MKKSYLLLASLLLVTLSACDSKNNNTKPYVEPAKDINSLADFEKMVSDNPIKNETTKTPVRYSLNIDLDFKNADKQYKIKDVEIIGNGHKLMNIHSDETDNSGLFSHVKNCIFRNLTIANTEIYGSNSGTLVGEVDGGIFEKIKIADSVIVGAGEGSQVGGLIGYAKNASIEYCENNAPIQGCANVGGIVGHAYNSDIVHCVNNGEISVFSGENIGGIVGKFENYWTFDPRDDKFESNENHGDVLTTESNFVGGLIGNHSPLLYLRGSQYPKVSISKCTNDGIIRGRNQVGGISGNAVCDLCDVIFTSCINQGTVIGEKYVGGIAGYTSDFSKVYEYTQGDEIKRVQFNSCKTLLNEAEDNYVVGEQYVGGIAGNGAYFRNCINNIEVKLSKRDEYTSGSEHYQEYQHSIGGIVGLGYGDTSLTSLNATSCTNNAKISGYFDEFTQYSYASGLGGICGFTYGGTFSGCENNGELFATHSIGGILGALQPSNTTALLNCKSNGNLNFFTVGGGLIGDIDASSERNAGIRISGCNVTIEEAKIYGTTASASDIYSAGGFIGRATSTSPNEADYGKATLFNSESHLSYKSPADAENMAIDPIIGFNKKISENKPFVSINNDSVTSELTRLGNIE